MSRQKKDPKERGKWGRILLVGPPPLLSFVVKNLGDGKSRKEFFLKRSMNSLIGLHNKEQRKGGGTERENTTVCSI